MAQSVSSIIRNVGIFGGAQVFSVLAALVRTKVAAVFVGTIGIGTSAIYNTVGNFFSNFAGLGLSSSGVKFLSEAFATGDENCLKKEVSSLRGLGMFCAIAGFLLCVLFSPLLSKIYFQDFSYTLYFCLLSIFVVSMILSGIEMAILKACQKTRYLAMSAILTAIVSVAVSVPFYIFCGVKGIIWAIVISGFIGALITCIYGLKTVKFERNISCFAHGHLHFNIDKTYKPLIILGIAFLAGGVIATGAEMILQWYFSVVASISIIGLYKAGYQLSITYTGMIFAAVGNDFYPRLSAISNDQKERNILINRQIKALVLVTVPVIIVFVLLVPYLLPLLFDDTFTPVTRMVQIASLSIIIKAISLPLNFLPLALGKSKDYIFLEGIFWLFLVVCVAIGYNIWELNGAGAGILLGHVIELFIILLFCKFRYGFSIFIS